MCVCFFFFNDTATTEIYTLSLHDALPISTPPAADDFAPSSAQGGGGTSGGMSGGRGASTSGITSGSTGGQSTMDKAQQLDRKSTRLNSSHANISYAVFCLKKKNRRSVCRS